MVTTVYFATNRPPFTEPGDGKILNFGSELGPTSGLDVRYGRADVQVDLNAETARFMPGSLQVADEKLIFPQGEGAVLGSTTIFDAIRSDMLATSKPTIAFIHGFSNSFTDAIERAAWIVTFYGIDANMFVFTWPSIASPIGIPLPFSDYRHDRGTAAASGPAVARTIRRLCDYIDSLSTGERCQQSIHLLCHSMGVFVLRNALQALMRMPDPASAANPDVSVSSMVSLSAVSPDASMLRRSFDKIVLAAADEDADAFDDPAKLKYLPRIGQSVTVYHSLRDWVLNTLSAGTKFNGPRLGSDGPDNMGSISDKITAVDVSPVTSFTQDPEEHQYYRIIPIIRDDIVQVLNGIPQDQIPNRTLVSPGRYRLNISAELQRAAAATTRPRAGRGSHKDWPK
jgi:esterase/lipase superfamily enzyme